MSDSIILMVGKCPNFFSKGWKMFDSFFFFNENILSEASEGVTQTFV